MSNMPSPTEQLNIAVIVHSPSTTFAATLAHTVHLGSALVVPAYSYLPKHDTLMSRGVFCKACNSVVPGDSEAVSLWVDRFMCI